MRRRYLVIILLSVVVPSCCESGEVWKYKVIYQLLTDRFSQGLSDPATPCSDLGNWCGGTYQGVIAKIGYLADLGVDAVWISPIVMNTELTTNKNQSGYHGYWAQDIYQIQTRFGSIEDLEQLVQECHNHNISVMVDVVPNHMGYQAGCDWEWENCPNLEDFSMFYPFNKPEYYHTPCQITDNLNQEEMERCRLANLPDLNQDNPEVRKILYDWIASLTARFGFDGYRIDTARHVDKNFWPEFQDSAGTFVLGEVAGDETRLEYDASYQEVMDGVLNFPTYYCLKRVFAEDFPMTYLKENLDKQREYFRNLKLTGTFIDNHDTMRFLNTVGKDFSKLRNALAFVLFGEGIPIIYAGTEHEFLGGESFSENRESVWPYFGQTSGTFSFLKTSLAIRKTILATVVEAEMVDCFVDENFYIVKKQSDKETIVLGITKAEVDGETLSVPISCFEGSDKAVFENVYSGQIFETENGALEVLFNVARDPVLLKSFQNVNEI